MQSQDQINKHLNDCTKTYNLLRNQQNKLNHRLSTAKMEVYFDLSLYNMNEQYSKKALNRK